VRIPRDLQGIFQCREIKKALKIKDLKTAASSVKLLSNELFKVIELIRSGILTDEQITQLVQEFFQNFIGKSEKFKAGGSFSMEAGAKDNLLSFFDFYIEKLKGYLLNNAERVEGFVDRFLERKNILLNKESDEYKKLRREFIKALIEYFSVEKDRIQGDYNNWYDDFRSSLKKKDMPNYPIQTVHPTVQPKGMLLSEVIRKYLELQIENKAWKGKDLREKTDFFSQFVEIIGDKDIATYSDEDALRVFKILKKFPKNWKKKKELRDKSVAELITLIEQDNVYGFDIISDTTVKKHLIWIRSIFEHAKVTNHFKEFKIKRKQKAIEEREPYSKEELQKWLDSPVYTAWNAKRVRENPEKFWVPLVTLLCGMRPNEVCQLYQEDIKKDKVNEIWFFDINDKKDKSVKTLDSVRLVPLHPLLIEFGFLKYCESQKHERIFPSLVNYEEGEGYAELYNKWAGRYNRQHITTAKKRVPYSMRHNFTTFLTNTDGVKDSLVDEITGHAHEGETRGRYSEYNLQNKFKAISKVDYGLDFSLVKYPFPSKKL
jgi:integrase